MSRPPAEIRAKRQRDGRFRVSYLDAPGRWISCPETTRAKALAWARRTKAENLAARAALTLAPFLDGFFAPSGAWAARAKGKGRSVGDLYLANRQGHLDRYVRPLFGLLDPRELTGRQIDDAILAAVRRSGKPLAPATKYKIVYSFHLVLEDLCERGIIERNPLEGIASYSKAPVSPRVALSREDMALLFPEGHGDLIRVWGSRSWASMMLAFRDTGIRPLEASRMRWRAFVGETVGDRKLWALVFPGAKGDKIRAPGLSARTAEELQAWREESREPGDDNYIWGAPTPAGILKAFRRGAVRACGERADRWITYNLRHSFVTHSLSTLSEEEIALLAGHSVAVDRIYQHPDERIALDRSREARRKLSESNG